MYKKIKKMYIYILCFCKRQKPNIHKRIKYVNSLSTAPRENKKHLNLINYHIEADFETEEED